MRTAFNYADCSTAERLKVGAIVVKDDRIISIGYNGQPAGWDNVCEEKVYMDIDYGAWMDPDDVETNFPFKEIMPDGRPAWYRLKTKPTVLHAERNALDKLARGSEGGEGSVLFVTHSPCLECAKSIYGAGIVQVYYAIDYRSTDGVEFLKQCNIPVIKLSLNEE